MSISKKLLIALLTATASVAGAVGFAACKDKPKPNPDPDPDGPVNENPNESVSVDAEAYEIAVANGAKDKDEWLADLKVQYNTADKEIKSVTASADGNLVITYTDNSTDTLTMAVKIYKVICKDNVTGAAVSNAWFQIGYMDGYNFTATSSAKNEFAKSGEDGVAAFNVIPEEGINYIVKIADPNNLADYLDTSDIVHSLPDKYETAFGTNNGFPITNLSFDSSRKTEALFENSANNFNSVEKIKIPYSRTGKGESNSTANGAFKVDVTANIYSYVYFNSFVTPSPNTDEERNKAAEAASGTYKFTITPANSATLFKFTGTSNNAPLNDKKVPAIAEYVTGGTADAEYDNGANYAKGVYTGTNSITLNITKSSVSGDSLFGILATSDCQISITVERISDAEENAPVDETKVTVPENIAKYPEKTQGTTLVLMPVTGAMITVKGSDGFYHVGSETGPVLLVQLNNALSRVSTVGISQFPLQKPTENDEPFGDSALTFSVYTNGKLTAVLNYADVIAAYSQKANSDGVYGVDDTLFNFITHYGATGTAIGTIPGNAYNWLLPCQYYQPEEGLPVTGDGTSSNPFVLTVGKNSVQVSGSANNLTFSAPETGIYTFKVSDGTISSTSPVFKSTKDSLNCLNVCVTHTGFPVTLKINGSGSSTVEVEKLNRNVTAEYDDNTQKTKGAEDNPITLFPGVSNVIISAANADGVWVIFKPVISISQQYVLELYGDNAKIIYNGETYTPAKPLTIDYNRDTEYKLLLTAHDSNGSVIFDSNFMLKAALPGSTEEEPSTELKVGDNNIAFSSANEASSGIVYGFTAQKGGIYTMTASEGSSVIVADVNDSWFNNAFIDEAGGVRSYSFSIETGQKLSFLIVQMDDKYPAFTLAIEEGGILTDNSPLVLGEKRDITIFDGDRGYTNKFVAENKGTYVITLEVTGTADGVTAFYKSINDNYSRPHDVELQLSGNVLTAEINITEAMLITGNEIELSLVSETATQSITAKLTVSFKN